MKSLQLLIGVMCLSAFIGLSSAEGMQIKSITRTVLPGDGKAAPPIHLLHTCYTGIFPDTVKKTRLEIGLIGSTNIIEATYYEESTGNPIPGEGCRNYVGDISTYIKQTIVFIMGGQDTEGHPVDDIYATAKFVIPDSFIDETNFKAQQIVADPAVTKGSLRFQSYPGGWKICDGASAREPYCGGVAGVTPPCYAIEVETIAKYSLCTEDINGKGGILATASFEPASTSKLILSPDAVVQLSYGHAPIYTLEKKKVPTTLKVTSTGIPDTLEFVPYQTPELVYGACSAVPCDLTSSYDRENDMKILIMNVDSSESATTSNVIIFKDYNIEGTHLGTEIIEMYWKKRIGEPYYAASLDGITVDNTGVAVDCSTDDPFDPTHTYCYAYFIELDAGTTHTASVASATIILTIDDLKPTLTNIITAEPQKTTSKNRAIHAEPIDITVTESNIVLDVCFTYITNTSNINTHYEFLAINSKGKWKKEIVNKKKDNSHACFHGLEVPLADFSEGSKFLVLLRDSDNGKPLASGEVTLDFPALRAIKPEVDNGNNGSTSTLAIVGAAIAGIACLMALVAAAIMFVMKINRNNDGLQYPLQHNNIEDSSTIHGLDNSIPTM